jgi:phosphoribosylglycinamide formyltransferase-1
LSGLRVTVLVSGSGSNLQALIDARDRGDLDLDFRQVISNRSDAFALKRAEQAGIATVVLPHKAYPIRDDFDQALARHIAQGDPELVILAGFMRIIGSAVLEQFPGRMVNLHPSLLPLYRGTNTYQRALDAGDADHGASLHFVSAELDGGPLISQVRIPVEPGDTAASLAARLSPREHQLMVSTAGLFCKGLVSCRGSQVWFRGQPLNRPLLLQADGSFLE